MMRRIRPTYAGVTSTLALFMALGGGVLVAEIRTASCMDRL